MTEHIPVLLDEVLECFYQKKITVFFDGTLGMGGHAKEILEAHPEIETYIGCDQDEDALAIAAKNLEPWKEKMVFIHENFSKIDQILDRLNIKRVDGFLCDIGVSSMQINEGERGFSFLKNGPLDMRMDRSKGISAKEVVNTYSEEKLGKIIKEYGEERHWKIITKLIVEYRKEKKFETTDDLAGLIQKNIRKTKKHLHAATLVFQALRIYVNQELEVLKTFLQKGLKTLSQEGRGVVISFHSLEDRIVKEFIKNQGIKDPVTGQKTEELKNMYKKPLMATEEEKSKNPRARSAKLRAFIKLGANRC